MIHLKPRQRRRYRSLGAFIVLVALLAEAVAPYPALAQEGVENKTCKIKLDLLVEPKELHLGNSLLAVSDLAIDCRYSLLPADVVYVIQRSSWEDRPLGVATDAERLQNVLTGVASSIRETLQRAKGSRIAVVSYDGKARLEQGLSDDAAVLTESLDTIRLGSTERDPATGLDRAATLLPDRDSLRVVIWIGGNSVKDEEAARRSSQRLLARGIRLAYVSLEGTEPFYKTLPSDVVRIGADPSRSIAPWVSAANAKFQAIQIESLELVYRRAPAFVWGPPGNGRPSAQGIEEHASFPFESALANDKRGFSATALRAGTTPLFDVFVARIRYSTGKVYDLPFPNPEITVVAPRPDAPLTQLAARGDLAPRLDRTDRVDAERVADFLPGDLAYLDQDQLLALGPDRIYMLSPRATVIRPWPCECPAVWRPVLLAADAARGRVFVVDALTESIWVFDRNGRRLVQLAPPRHLAGGQPSWIVDLAIAPDGQTYLLMLLREQPIGARLVVRVYDAALTGPTEWEARTPDGWLDFTDLEACPTSRRRDWAKLATQGDDRLIIWTNNQVQTTINDWRKGLNVYRSNGEWLTAWEPPLPGAFPDERNDGLDGRWDLIGVDQGLWVQRLGWLLRYTVDGELAQSQRLEAKLRWWSGGGFDFFGALRDDLRGPQDITSGLAPRPDGGMSFPIAWFFLPGTTDSDNIRRLWPEHGFKSIFDYGETNSHHAGILTMSDTAQWSAYVPTIERPPIDSFYPERAEGIDALRGTALGDGRLVIGDPTAFGLRIWEPKGFSGFLPLPVLPLDLSTGPQDDLLLLGIDAGGPALFRYTIEGEQLWRQACDCAIGQGIATTAGEVFVAARRGRSVLRFGLTDGKPRGALPKVAFHGLGPVDLSADPLDPDGLLSLNLRQRRVEGWRWPSSLGTGSDAPSRPAQAWNLAPGRGALDMAVASDGRIALIQVDGRVRVQDRQGAVLAEWQPEAGNYPAAPTDLVWSADGRGLAILDGRLAPQLGHRPRLLSYTWPPSQAPDPTPGPTADGGPGTCLLQADTNLDRGEFWVGQPFRVTHIVRAECPPGSDLPIDAVVALMASAPNTMDVEPVKRAANAFVDALDLTQDQVSVAGQGPIGFCGVQQILTDDRNRIGQTITQMATRICRPSMDIYREIGAGGRARALPMIVAMANRASTSSGELLRSSIHYAYLAERGVPIKVVELRPDVESPLLPLATSPEDYLAVSNEGELIQAARSLGQSLGALSFKDVALESVWNPALDFVSDSILPSQGVRQGDRVRHDIGSVAHGVFTLSYELRPRVPGRYPVTSSATFLYTEADGQPRRLGIPPLEISVDVPPPTPTSTATPGPLPRSLYLPMLLREACVEDVRRADVALVLDASLSMLEPAAPGAGRSKLDGAREAARVFLDSLKPQIGDQATIIAFNTEARVLVPLSGDREGWYQALADIQPSPGTCIVCGIQVGADALSESAQDPAHAAVLVLLTDGRSNPQPVTEAVEQARLAKAAGIHVYTIGLGAQIEEAALREMATSPVDYRHAPSAEDLVAIYQQIAVSLPCPKAAFWGGR